MLGSLFSQKIGYCFFFRVPYLYEVKNFSFSSESFLYTDEIKENLNFCIVCTF